MSSGPRNDCDVLVVGAGPTGLMAANLLKRSGVRVRIVDAQAHASRESRAFAIQARTMELFQHLGVVEKLLDRGVICPGVEFYVGGKHAGGLNYDLAGSPDTPYPFIFLLPQSRTEAILIEDLSAQGVEVEREMTITGLTQDADGVVARGTAGGGAATEIRSGYMIGADGAHSVVRKALGLSFEGCPLRADLPPRRLSRHLARRPRPPRPRTLPGLHEWSVDRALSAARRRGVLSRHGNRPRHLQGG